MSAGSEAYRLAMVASDRRAAIREAIARDNRQTLPELIASARALGDLIHGEDTHA